MTLWSKAPFVLGALFSTALMVQIEPVLVSLALGAFGSALGYLIHKVLDTDRTLNAHIASDREQFKAIGDNFEDVKLEQRNQSGKLDRLLEHSRDVAEEAVNAARLVHQSAAIALDVVERAKVTALSVLATETAHAKRDG